MFAEQDIYLNEGLRWRKVDYTDNSETLVPAEAESDGNKFRRL